ncbi:FAD-binding protein [Candidatus Bathyarchaeota archaeon]|nr:MAG: FAD-binding protein [Candidatus Bathyarchaeota archaeon]
MVIHVQSDVLIVGTGGAGLRAAIEAHEKGAKVVIVSKAPAGYNNCTIVAGNGYLAALGGMSIEEHRERTLSTGKGLNDPALVEVLVNEGAEKVLELERFGCVVNVHRGGINVGGPESKLGQGITLPMVQYIRKLGIEIVENVILTKLLKKDGAVVGAVGYSSREEQPVIFQTKAVLLASGGAGGLFKRTDCPKRTTGDGYSLAFQAGARLRDMEFCQFFPLALAEPDQPSLLVDGKVVWEGKILNANGEDIPAKHHVTERPYIAKSRDLLSRAMMREVHDGAGVEGAVLLDAREVVKNGKPGDFYGMGSYEYYVEKLRAHERPIRIAPLSHFTMGGIVANTYGETDVPGLFAAGEVVGGVHGANRHGGNALTDVTVFGVRTAKKAVEYAESKSMVDVDELAESEIERYKRLASRDTGFTPPTLMDLVRENMWENVGVIRDSYTLVEAYQKLSELRDSTRSLLAKPGKQLLNALELIMALDVCEYITRAAMERRESRGAHFRLDHPTEDPTWRKTIILSKKDGAIQVGYAAIGEAF